MIKYQTVGFFVDDRQDEVRCIINGVDSCWVCDESTKKWWIVGNQLNSTNSEIGPFDTWEDAATYAKLAMA